MTSPKFAVRVLLFAAGFVLLQGLYVAARGTWVERLVVEDLTVRPTALLLQLVVPEWQPRTRGHQIVTDAARLGIYPGCEGMDIVILFAIAVAAAPRSWRSRVGAIVLGGAVLVAANVVRLAMLVLALAHSRAMFGALHEWITPVAMVGVAMALYWCWMGRGAGNFGGAA